MRDLDPQPGKPRGEYKGMKCPHCKTTDGSRIIDVRDTDGGKARYRRHVCDRCEGRFTTYEITATEFERLQQVKVDEVQVKKAIVALTTIKSQLGNGLI